MSIDFTHDYGTGHTVLKLARGSVASLPLAMTTWLKKNTGWGGADQYVMTLCTHAGGPVLGSGYRLQLTNPTSTTFKVAGVLQALHFGIDFEEAVSGALNPSGSWVEVR